MPGWGIASDGREVSIVQCCRLLEMDVISEVIMGSGVRDEIPRLLGFQKVGSYRTWLQLMCCASLVVHPYISEYPEIQDVQIWS